MGPLARQDRFAERGVSGNEVCAALGGVLGVVVSAFASVACDRPAPGFDSQSVVVDLSSGAMMTQIAVADERPLPALIDILSPITLVDMEGSRVGVRRRLSMLLYSVDAAGQATVPRVKFDDTAVFEIRPCNGVGPCQIGEPSMPRSIHAVIGFDILSNTALEIDFPSSEVHFFPDIAGSELERRRACEAVFNRSFAGGGTLHVAGDNVSYLGRRVAIRTCLHPDDERVGTPAGTNVLLVMSTALGPSVLAQRAYERYQQKSGAASYASLPRVSVLLPFGPISGREALIPRAALLGETSEGRGACRELFASRVMAAGGCDAVATNDCPCSDKKSFCRAGAAVLIEESVRFIVIPDETDVLQSLRDELRPAVPEVDGLLGTSALASLNIALDYPNSRILMRCTSRADCQARPTITDQRSLAVLERCGIPTRGESTLAAW